MLDATAELLHRQGYAATGLNQIIADSGAPKGSLYFHFPGGKEELVSRAIERASEPLTELLERVLAAAPTPEDAIDGVVAYFGGQLATSAYAKGCPVATVALEQAATSNPLHTVCSSTYARWQQLVAARLATAGFAPARAAELASFALSAIEGALMLCRAHRSLDPLARTAAELRRHLQHERPTP
jgi:TetR/AcrR family transcriptional repressor of lmrAB and yxaGH operons